MRRDHEARAVFAARAAVERVAPEELPLFEETARAWRRVRARRPRGEDMLGFGLGEVEPVVTTAALAAAWTAVGFISRTAVEAARDETSSAIRSRVRLLVRRLVGLGPRGDPAPTADVASPPSTAVSAPVGLPRLRQVILQRLLATGLPAERAALVADAIIGALVTGGDDAQQ